MNKKFIQSTILSVLSGLLLALSFPPFEISLLGWVGIVPLIFSINGDDKRSGFLWGYISGIMFFGCTLYWMVNVTIPGMIVLVSVLALFCGFFGICVRYTFSRSVNLLVLPFFWVVLEYIRSNIFTGFPWAGLGYSQYENTSIMQIADITGTYGISFLMIAFSVAVFAFIKRMPKRTRYMVKVLIILVAVTVYGINRINTLEADGSISVSVIQGNVPQEEKWDTDFADKIVDKYTGLSMKAAKASPDIIVWPETSYPYLIEGDPYLYADLNKLSDIADRPVLLGGVYLENDRYFNSAVFLDKKTDEVMVYKKMHLVPFGEYIPFREKLYFLRKYIDKPIGDFTKGKERVLFPVKVTNSDINADGTRMRRTRFLKFGALICFEDIFPYITREYRKEGADFVVNMTNDAWFGRTAASRQHLQASVFRAIENRCPVIRAANTGISCFISAKGQVSSVIEKEGKEIFVAGQETDKVEIYSDRSFYTLYGDAFVFLNFLVLLMVFLVNSAFFIRWKKGIKF